MLKTQFVLLHLQAVKNTSTGSAEKCLIILFATIALPGQETRILVPTAT